MFIAEQGLGMGLVFWGPGFFGAGGSLHRIKPCPHTSGGSQDGGVCPAHCRTNWGSWEAGAVRGAGTDLQQGQRGTGVGSLVQWVAPSP